MTLFLLWPQLNFKKYSSPVFLLLFFSPCHFTSLSVQTRLLRVLTHLSHHYISTPYRSPPVKSGRLFGHQWSFTDVAPCHLPTADTHVVHGDAGAAAEPRTPWLLSSRSPLHLFLSPSSSVSPPGFTLHLPKAESLLQMLLFGFCFLCFHFRFLSLTWSNVTVSIEYVAGRTPKAQDLLECQWGLPRQDHVMWPMNHLEVILCAHGTHGFFASLSPLHFFLRKQSSFWKCKCIRCLPDFSPCPSPFFFFFFLLSASSAALYRSVSVSPFWLVEDVSNLTASDVMNRVNLGYLQGNLCACVCDRHWQTCEWFTSHRVEKGVFFHPFTGIHWKISALNPWQGPRCVHLETLFIVNHDMETNRNECRCLELQDISEQPYTEGTRPSG